MSGVLDCSSSNEADGSSLLLASNAEDFFRLLLLVLWLSSLSHMIIIKKVTQNDIKIWSK